MDVPKGGDEFPFLRQHCYGRRRTEFQTDKPNRNAEFSSAKYSGQYDEHCTAFHFGRISFQIHADGRALGFTGGEIKPTVVLGTFDEMVHHEAAGQMDLGVGAQAIRDVEFIVSCPVNRERAIAMIEAQHIFRLNVGHVAGFDPEVAHIFWELKFKPQLASRESRSEKVSPTAAARA